eukprot:scaffold4414_cov135-Isochrysis_galbana.AAC.5
MAQERGQHRRQRKKAAQHGKVAPFGRRKVVALYDGRSPGQGPRLRLGLGRCPQVAERSLDTPLRHARLIGTHRSSSTPLSPRLKDLSSKLFDPSETPGNMFLTFR